ncbi:FtsK/SpoIIIE domain-containing protein, partial [Brachybacterium alimentarium]|uniref:FtsK/SpoIIIE domain-containing protein n=1 Tax=Brachybacterium alimentarium TaxID=47845 RepID=UPI001C697266
TTTRDLTRSWHETGQVKVGWIPFSWRLASVAVTYPSESPDIDPEWQGRVVDTIVRRAGFRASRSKWQSEKLRVVVRRRRPEREKKLGAVERARVAAGQRVKSLLAGLFGVPIVVRVADWAADSGASAADPTRIEIDYEPMTRDTSEVWRHRLETIVALKVPGNTRWRGRYDTAGDRIVLEPRPELPRMVQHPGPAAWAGAKTIALPYGEGEGGTVAAWDISGPLRNSTVHTLVIGPTGGGKTTLIRSVVVGATSQGVVVLGGDPKRIELTPFRGWPGVAAVASSVEDLGLLIKAVHSLMEYRYAKGETEGNQVLDDMPWVILILDEQLILNAMLNRWWAKNKANKDNLTTWGTDKGTVHPMAQGRLQQRLGREGMGAGPAGADRAEVARGVEADHLTALDDRHVVAGVAGDPHQMVPSQPQGHSVDAHRHCPGAHPGQLVLRMAVGGEAQTGLQGQGLHHQILRCLLGDVRVGARARQG